MKEREAVDFLEKGDTSAALERLREARALVDIDYTGKRTEWVFDGLIGHLQRESGERNEALLTMRKVIEDTDSDPDVRVVVLNTMADTYSEMSMPDSALKYLKLSSSLNDSLYRSQQYGLIRDIGSSREIRKLDSRIEIAETRRRTARTVMWCAIGGALIFLLSGATVVVQNRKLKQRNRDLYRKNMELVESGSLTAAPVTDAMKKYSGSSLADEASSLLCEKIKGVLDNVEEIASNDFSLDRLAHLVDSNTGYVSQVINETFGKNFSTLLGERRVRLACERLSDSDNYGQFTIEAIASGLGFRSRSNFVTVFKRVTGLTPSELRRISLSEKQEGKH